MSSACLPRHPAVAYLCLVRSHEARSSNSLHRRGCGNEYLSRRRQSEALLTSDALCTVPGISSGSRTSTLTNRTRQRPRFETTSAGLPRHPAVAYLFLVRWRSDRRSLPFCLSLG